MNRKRTLLVTLLFIGTALQAGEIERVEPPFWWTDMPVSGLQLQLYGEGLGQYRASVDYPGVSIKKQIAVDSPNYLFLYLEIESGAKPGELSITLTTGEYAITLAYSLEKRAPSTGRNQGFNASNVIYLIMPDRFTNGNQSNDSISGMLEKADRSDPTKRQGGDIRGIVENLDYIAGLGMTAVWFTPMFENDMAPEYGAYHGYAATDLYRVDRRLGTNDEYKNLVQSVHARGMKVIMDMIHNHIGDHHWWMKDLPTNDWVHDFDKHGLTNFRGTIPADPYASKYDRDRLIKGWFVPEMPDLDQRNEILADYLIQNTIWWIEFSGIDGIRMDTYLYPYPDYMSRWVEEILTAYPNFNIVGEAWVETVAGEAFWQRNQSGIDDGYESYLPTVTDFPLSFAIRDALIEDFGHTSGLRRLYYLLSQDSLYSDPSNNIIFLDNHDMGRIYEQLGTDMKLFKMAYAFLMTTRGIPQVYYGTELMMGHEDRGGDDEGWRQTMPGGWLGDKRSVFTKSGRTKSENEIIEYITKLTTWRNTAQAIHDGALLHFIPENNIYVYFRILPEETVMVIMNRNDNAVNLDLSRFSEAINSYQSGFDPLTENLHELSENLKVPGKTTLILDLVE